MAFGRLGHRRAARNLQGNTHALYAALLAGELLVKGCGARFWRGISKLIGLLLISLGVPPTTDETVHGTFAKEEGPRYSRIDLVCEADRDSLL